MAIQAAGTTRTRSKAWAYYLVLAFASFVGAFAGHPIGLIAPAACGLYSRYLYRGGRIVFWIW
jgi:hypothetical protein